MLKIEIFRKVMPFHPMLGWNAHQDSRSWAYALQPKQTPIVAVRHAQAIAVLNQGQIGACTGNASTSCAYHVPFYAPGAPSWRYTPDETGAQSWYHDNTVNDGYPGTWKPDDTGSDSLTSSKMAVAAGIASGYQMSGDLDSSLETLQDRPGITGIPWYQSMFDAPSNGLLTVDMKSGLAGGHCLVVDEIVTADQAGNGTGSLLVGGDNSWDTSWGNQGRWYMKGADWWALRQQQGDAYFWTAKSQPAPTPTPTPGDDTDANLWNAVEHWALDEKHVGDNRRAASAVQMWAHVKGLA